VKRGQGYKIAVVVLSLVIILQWLFIFVTRPKKVPKIPLAVKGKIAIVIDDWGYNLNNLLLLSQIRYPLTMSVLPNLSYSRAVTGEFKKLGFEIILHLPMEPHEKYRLEQRTIMTSMNEQEIAGILKSDLAAVPYASGVSNHMGSKASEDSRTMAAIFKELKNRKLYFLDSLVSGRSICTDLARKMDLAFAKRDVFLDNQEDPVYIKRQIYKLKVKATVYGQAIGIGHDRKITLEVLKEALPELEKEGYKLVFVSELVK
jgi:polysaccharide deacetylase 2 family uncharacterized protein YibQ